MKLQWLTVAVLAVVVYLAMAISGEDLSNYLARNKSVCCLLRFAPWCSTFSSITVIALPGKGWGKCLTYWYQYLTPRSNFSWVVLPHRKISLMPRPYPLMRKRIWWQKPESLCSLQNLGATNEISSGTMIGLIILMWKCECLHFQRETKTPRQADEMYLLRKLKVLTSTF